MEGIYTGRSNYNNGSPFRGLRSRNSCGRREDVVKQKVLLLAVYPTCAMLMLHDCLHIFEFLLKRS
jgi:hypothetical protein